MKILKIVISASVLIFFFSPLYSQLWKQYADSAKACGNQKNTDKAIEFYYKAKRELKKDSISTNSYATLCIGLAKLYWVVGQYEKAEPLYLEAMQILEKVLGKEHPDYAGSCYSLAGIYIAMGQYERAEPPCLEAKKIREKVLGKEHPDYVQSCNGLAILYMDMGQFEKAEALYLICPNPAIIKFTDINSITFYTVGKCFLKERSDVLK